MMKRIKPVAALLISAIIFISAVIPVSAQVTAMKTPVNAEETRLKWSLKIGSGYRDAPSVPTADGNFVFVMSRNKLYKQHPRSLGGDGQSLFVGERGFYPCGHKYGRR